MRLWNLIALAPPLAALTAAQAGSGKRPNIVLIMTDDQDQLLGSTAYQPVLQREMMQKGTEFTNHFTTTAICCPSRASLLRGQMAHNTNITHVAAPGGNYDKFTSAGLDEDYLPQWLKKAGYRVEYLGKLLNGYDVANYDKPAPKGWDFINSLTDPYTQSFNFQVMSENGARPRLYQGFHQSDIIRAQSIDRLEYLTGQEQPFFITIAPTSPHEQYDYFAPVPLTRHKGMFANVSAPRRPNWNPADSVQKQKSSYLKDLPPLTQRLIDFGDFLYQQRLEALQGIDEIVEDVFATLEAKGVLNNTYVIYTTDNGWHIGLHRAAAGKSLPYADDTNLPFVVRGPNIPQGVKSTLPSTHIDLVPTLLDIAGVAEADLPPQLDGRSLLPQWQQPNQSYDGCGTGVGCDILNVEFWGSGLVEAPPSSGNSLTSNANNSYKSLRLVGEEHSWLLIKWCTNEVELYNTRDDPYELTNLALGVSGTDGGAAITNPDVKRVLTRLNAILLVTKSCTLGTCRDPWTVLQPPTAASPVRSLKQALDPSHDAFYSGLPEIKFGKCMTYQHVANEEPYYPPGAAEAITRFRKPTDNYVSPRTTRKLVQDLSVFHGGPEQRHSSWAEIAAASRELTDEELDQHIDKRDLAEIPVLEWWD